MFKDATTPMDNRHFGVGSTISAGSKSWLVVGSVAVDSVTLVDLETMISGGSSRVADRNFLTETEARALVGHLQFTFSDFSFDPKGLKNIHIG